MTATDRLELATQNRSIVVSGHGLLAAFNDAVRRVEQTVQEKFSGMASGLNLPPGLKLPF